MRGAIELQVHQWQSQKNEANIAQYPGERQWKVFLIF